MSATDLGAASALPLATDTHATAERGEAGYLRTTAARFLRGNVRAEDLDWAAENWLRLRRQADG